MSVKSFCPQCLSYHDGLCHILHTQEDGKIVEMQKDIQVLIKYCDPQQMTFEDHLIWEKYYCD